MSESPILLSLKDSDEISFSSHAKFGKWLAREQEIWSWLSDDRDYGQNLFNQTRNILNTLKQSCEKISLNEDDHNAQNQFREFKQRLQQQIDSGNFVPSRTDLGQFVLGLSKESISAAVDVLRVSTFQRKSGVPNDLSSYQGIVLYTLYQHGVSKKSFQTSRAAFSKLLADISQAQDEFHISADKKLSALDASVLEREGKVRQSIKNLAAILRSHKSNTRQEQFELRGEVKDQLIEFENSSKSRIEKFEEYYENKVALLEPVSYWRGKKGWHIIGTIVSGVIFFGYCATLAVAIGKFIFEFDGGVIGFISFWKDADLSALGAVALLLALLMVLARIFYRIFASQLHLWNDASERVTMTQTYLAFAEKGHVKDEHLQTILERLFSPASDGVVKDDFGSLGPIDSLLGRMNR